MIPSAPIQRSVFVPDPKNGCNTASAVASNIPVSDTVPSLSPEIKVLLSDPNAVVSLTSAVLVKSTLLKYSPKSLLLKNIFESFPCTKAITTCL